MLLFKYVKYREYYALPDRLTHFYVLFLSLLFVMFKSEELFIQTTLTLQDFTNSNQ